MTHQGQRTFVFCSIHRDPFPEATTPLSRVARYFLSIILFIVQLTLMIGVPATPSILAWFTRRHLWQALADTGNVDEAKEALVHLILGTVLLAFLIWGSVPVFATARFYGGRARNTAYITIGGVLAVFFGVSVRTVYLTRNWELRFDNDTKVAENCRLVTQVLGSLIFLCWISFVVSFFYLAVFGTPMFMRQMLNDATKLLFHASPDVQNKESDSDHT
ncbi:hypothetical protein FLAG1_12088 [Fusarium langsethiae]|uniref:Uncharacterized protein n=1 Tax=Fusarium langsethiae TaxID=179993 RepID=A0A0N0V4I2_FUSLA|nr:hypothetical protein FLAG1_12088 [Fusarium langsethiae]GKU16984.1 unnamed protein product [Fusarium langsethiae]